MSFTGKGDAVLARGTYVSGDFFSTLGVPMYLGQAQLGQTTMTRHLKPLPRSFSITTTGVSQFASDPGRQSAETVRLNKISAMIVGVADPHFTNFASGKFQDFYMPLSLVTRVLPGHGGRQRRPVLFDACQFLGRHDWQAETAGAFRSRQAQAAAATIFRNETIHGSKPLFQEADDPTIHLYSIEQSGLQGENVQHQIAPMLYTLMMVGVGIGAADRLRQRRRA